MATFIANFENSFGFSESKIIKDCPNLEDATIEASNIAEEKGWELLEVFDENEE